MMVRYKYRKARGILLGERWRKEAGEIDPELSPAAQHMSETIEIATGELGKALL